MFALPHGGVTFTQAVAVYGPAKSSEDNASPDHPHIAAESKLYSTNSSPSLGENDLQENGLVRSSNEYNDAGNSGSIVYSGAEGEIELRAQDIRFIRGEVDKTTVTRSDLTPEKVRSLQEKQGLSDETVYESGDVDEDVLESEWEQDPDVWRSRLSDEFVERTGNITGGVVASGAELVEEGKVKQSNKYRYTAPNGEIQTKSSERAEERPVGSDEDRPSNE